MDMNYCMHCGARLRLKRHETEGDIPWCDGCGDWRFPVFSTAVSTVILNPDRTTPLLIQQYGRPFYILCAGYVNKGEDAEDAVRREIREELGLEARDVRFNRSHYFAPSNTLMLNFTAVADDGDAHPNREVDAWRWFPLEEGRRAIKPGSLAAAFLNGFLDGVYTFPR